MTATTAVTSGHQQRSTDAVERCLLGLDVAVLIQLLGRGDVGVTEDQLGIAGGHAEVLQQRGRRVAQMVQLDAAEPGLLAHALEYAHEIAGPQRRAFVAEEDQIAVRCQTRTRGLMLTQSVANRREERQVTYAGIGLYRSDVDLAADFLELLADVHLVLIPVDITPPQSEHLAATHAVERQE